MKFICRDFPEICFKRFWKAPINIGKLGEGEKAGQGLGISVKSSLVAHEDLDIL